MQKTPIRPSRLRPGDTIGVAAPASPFDYQAFEKGLECLQKLGLKTRLPEALFARNGYLAGSDAQRAQQLNELFADDQVKAIFCARGGYGAIRILPCLDVSLIKAHPKIIIGYSDITAILSVVSAKTGLVVFHGPLITELGSENLESVDSMAAALMGAQPITLKSKTAQVICPGTARGIVAGGNLTTLVHLLGTPFAPGLKGCILFLEDRGEAAYRVDRMLMQMKLAGCFDQVAGLVLGQFEDCGNEAQIHEIVKELLGEYAFPVVAGFCLGHGRPNYTLPLGLPAALDTQRCCLQFDQPPTRGKVYASG